MTGTASSICILSFSPTFGGVATFQASQIDFLLSATHSKILLIDEFPESTTNKLKSHEHNSRLAVVKIPLWSRSKTEGANVFNRILEADAKIILISNLGILIKYASQLRLAQKRLGAKVIFTCHSGVFEWRPRAILLQLASSLAMLLVDDLIFVSEFTKRYWKLRFPWLRFKRSRVLPNSVDITEQPLHKEIRKKFAVGFVGRLSQEKDPELFCKVAKLAATEGLPFSFHIFGDGPLLNDLQQSYQSEITWHSTCSSLDELYGQLDILLVTSLVENCPFSILESKSRGVPTVSVAVGGIPEILTNKEDGILVEGRSVKRLCDGLKQAAEQHSKLAEGCLRSRHRFNPCSINQAFWGPHVDLRADGLRKLAAHT